MLKPSLSLSLSPGSTFSEESTKKWPGVTVLFVVIKLLRRGEGRRDEVGAAVLDGWNLFVLNAATQVHISYFILNTR